MAVAACRRLPGFFSLRVSRAPHGGPGRHAAAGGPARSDRCGGPGRRRGCNPAAALRTGDAAWLYLARWERGELRPMAEVGIGPGIHARSPTAAAAG